MCPRQGTGSVGLRVCAIPASTLLGMGTPETLASFCFCLCGVIFGYLIPTHTLNVKYYNKYVEKN